VRNDYEQSVAAERVLARQIADLKMKSVDTGQSLIGLRELERAVEANKKVYEEFLLRSRELSEQQSIFANASYIITPAGVPSQPSGLTLPLLLAIGFVMGFPIGGALAVARAQLANMGFAPDQPSPNRRPEPARTQALCRLQKRDIEAYLQRGCLSRVVVPSDAIAEFANSVETALPHGERLNLLIAGASEEAPSAEVAAALAASWAYDGYDVLLVDGDTRASRLTAIAGLTDLPGLYDRLHRDVAEFVRWGRSGLPHVLPLASPAQRRDIAGARRIVGQRLEDLEESVENLIVDGGDLATNEFAPALAGAATAAILVCAPGEDAARARQLLLNAGVPILGVIELPAAKTQVRVQPATTPPAETAVQSAGAENTSRFSFLNRLRLGKRASAPPAGTMKSA